tara:strand:+ start:2060 stop:3322 length:1263 start_codon:yes stop_codon:yes gene_type:complete
MISIIRHTGLLVVTLFALVIATGCSDESSTPNKILTPTEPDIEATVQSRVEEKILEETVQARVKEELDKIATAEAYPPLATAEAIRKAKEATATAQATAKQKAYEEIENRWHKEVSKLVPDKLFRDRLRERKEFIRTDPSQFKLIASLINFRPNDLALSVPRETTEYLNNKTMSLKGIEYFAKQVLILAYRRLDFYRRDVLSLAPISSLTSLRALQLGGELPPYSLKLDDTPSMLKLKNPDLSPISKLNALQRLEIHINNGISEDQLKSIGSHPQLVFLSFTPSDFWLPDSAATKVKRATTSNLPNNSSMAIDWGSLDIPPFEDLSHLSSMDSLEVLRITAQTNIKDLTPLVTLKNLRVVHMHESNYCDDESPTLPLWWESRIQLKKIRMELGFELVEFSNDWNCRKLVSLESLRGLKWK